MVYERYVALGDSSTEGLDDPDGNGGYRGWANRLAEHVATEQGSLLYANLGVRGRHTREIRNEQLAPALTMKPALCTLFSGTNDIVSRRFDLDAVLGDIEAMHGALIGQGATLLTFTLPELSTVMPAAGRIAPRLEALNEALRSLCSRSGALLVDFAAHPVAADPRLWSEDRLHANSAGHERIAAALAHRLGLPGADAGWSQPLPETSPRGLASRIRGDLSWAVRYLIPWLWRHARGRSSGDGRSCKRPELTPV